MPKGGGKGEREGKTGENGDKVWKIVRLTLTGGGFGAILTWSKGNEGDRAVRLRSERGAAAVSILREAGGETTPEPPAEPLRGSRPGRALPLPRSRATALAVSRVEPWSFFSLHP